MLERMDERRWFVKKIRPFLKIKAEQADISLAFFDTSEARGHHITPQTRLIRLHLSEMMQEANARHNTFAAHKVAARASSDSSMKQPGITRGA
jgi:hypothetical protein